jgi:Flp pilus assembly protein TadG
MPRSLGADLAWRRYLGRFDLRSFLRRIAKDKRGNSLVFLGAALLPLLAAIGSGVDIGRAYMARAKLQQAVDAAALAGRRAMTGDDIETAKPEASAYLAFNYPNGLYGTTPVVSSVTKPDVGEVKVDAKTSLPTAIMSIFGYKTIDIAVTGVAVQTFKNVDIMLVLDTTGSMSSTLNGVRKIDALKSAVRALYQQLAPAQELLKKKGLRMRFGVVPYAATTNVGKLLYSKNPSYIRTSNVPYYHYKKTGFWFFGSWEFGQQKYNLTNFAAGSDLGDINGDGSSDGKWAGCIEERKTDPGILANDTRDAAPSTAFDLDIDRIPGSSDDTKYAPYIYDPRNGSVNTSCPAEATELTEMTAAELDTLLNKLQPSGNTYHDLGMIWGTRMISNGGIWGASNPDTYKQIGVQRYIIYMTDGVIQTDRDVYSSYGLEVYDKRAGATSDTDNNGRHTKRFLMACNAAKAKSISIWTIAFGTGRVDSLDRCASSVDQSSIADNSDDLIERFATIGKSIGSLRIAQ